VLFTIPAIPEYKRMYNWFSGLISHSGKYGHGEKELIDLETYIPNIFKIIGDNQILGIVIGLGISLIIFSIIQNLRSKEEKETDWNIRILTGLVLSCVFGIMLVAKQFNANHYLIPILLLIGISLFFILNILQKLKVPSIIERSMLPVIVFGLILFLSWRQPEVMKNVNYGYRISNEEIDSVNTMLERNYPEHTRINYYSYSLNKFNALKFGDVYTKNKMLATLNRVYPNTYFYDFSRNKVLDWDTEISWKEIIELNGNKLLMINGPFNEKMMEEIGTRGFPLKNIYKGRVQVVYELDTTRYSQ
jgi:hypothetical protein